jgi:DICT domain-containing protein
MEKRSYDDVKVSTDLGIDNEGVWTAIHEQLHQAVSLVVASITAQYPSLQV